MMPNNQTEERIKVAKLTAAELEAELASKQKEVDENNKREAELAAERAKQLLQRQTENLDKLIEMLVEHEQKVQTAKEDHEKRCTKANKRTAIIEQADKDLHSKLIELDSALALYRRGLELPYNCPRKLEEVKVFKAQFLKNEAEKDARQKAAAEESKKQQERWKAQDALYLLNQEKAAREKKEQETKIEAHDKQLNEKAAKNYSVWHKTLGAAIAVAVCFMISPALPVTAAAYAFFAAAALFGASLGQIYRTSVIDAGKSYRFKADVDNLQDYWKYRLEDKVSALKAGVEAASWKGYFNSFGNGPSYTHTKEFRAGMIQAVTQNEEVVKAIRNR